MNKCRFLRLQKKKINVLFQLHFKCIICNLLLLDPVDFSTQCTQDAKEMPKKDESTKTYSFIKPL